MLSLAEGMATSEFGPVFTSIVSRALPVCMIAEGIERSVRSFLGGYHSLI